ncbi:cytochrome P450 [Alicyclobacillus mali (ex Roth et al. 2021)]|uniref:cytochrome P450 n=1 Tax=Alicyclobacillus mali (ex Roth et al. 2021) TaxID=1123961 RepID=UPI0023F4A750|nr:cytochrome P450 [Alicyclobacillus mali (ex Roth et al. 2021)]
MREDIHRGIPSTRNVKPEEGWQALRNMLAPPGSPLMGLLSLHRAFASDEFELAAPRLRMRVAAGPASIKRVLHEQADAYSSRLAGDPVTALFGQGLLVIDGPRHGAVKDVIVRSSTRGVLESRLRDTLPALDEALHRALGQGTISLPDMPRRMTWRALESVYFHHRLTPEEERAYLSDLTHLVHYIGPGWWLLLGKTPRLPKAYHRMRLRLSAMYDKALIRRDNAPIHALAQAYGDEETPFAVDQLMTLLVAGHDTATSLLSSLLILLAHRPDLQDALWGEIHGATGRERPEIRVLDRLPLLDAVVKETLRLYPPIHSGLRSEAESGDRVMVSYFLLHRHQELWPDADSFVPERWLSGLAPGAYTYLPFGAGPRYCPGATFARMEVKWMLARLLQHVSLQPTSRPPRIAMRAALEHRPTVIAVRRR